MSTPINSVWSRWNIQKYLKKKKIVPQEDKISCSQNYDHSYDSIELGELLAKILLLLKFNLSVFLL